MGDFKTLTDMVRLAQNNLDKGDWDYLVGAADTEASLRRNRSALESWVFLPRILQDVSKVNTATHLLGQTLRIPVVLPPIGSIQAFTERGGSAVAQAAAEFGVLQILSSSCAPDFETVAKEVTAPGLSVVLVWRSSVARRPDRTYHGQRLCGFLFNRRYPFIRAASAI